MFNNFLWLGSEVPTPSVRCLKQLDVGAVVAELLERRAEAPGSPRISTLVVANAAALVIVLGETPLMIASKYGYLKLRAGPRCEISSGRVLLNRPSRSRRLERGIADKPVVLSRRAGDAGH